MRGFRAPLWLEVSAAILLALVASNALTFAVVEADRARLIRAERLSAVEDRVSAVTRLLLRLPDEHEDILQIASVRRERVSIGTRPRVAAEAARDSEAEARVKLALAGTGLSDVRIAKRGSPDFNWFGLAERRRGGYERLSVAIALSPGRWLNGEFVWPPGASLLSPLVLSAGVAALALIAVAVWLSYRLSGPLQRLSAASSEMARGRAVAPVPETGPFVLRNAAQAFNTMSRRLMATLENQRVLLASIAHDLRTPITSLRLKSEFIADADLAAQMRASLDELQTTTEAALEAARTGMGEEPAREVDVSALVESLCADLADMGSEVAFQEGAVVRGQCRPNEIKRAARNLIENAVRYGSRARVAVARDGEGRIAITIDDDGPGLTAEQRALVFEPFVRLDPSRSRETGGLGLGLTLARAIARGHGGDIALANREGAGLRATMTVGAD